jgi:methionyl-tRNA formyltransferase
MTTAVVCAYSIVGTYALKSLLETGVKVTALYTYPQNVDEQWFEPPAVIAKQHGIPLYFESKFNADHVYDAVRALNPDFLFSFYFREMIAARFLAIPKLGAYNFHGSLLPKYRGRAPINWVLVNGEREAGMTLHAMTPKPDDGDIIAQEKFALDWDETALSLIMRCAKAAQDIVKTEVPKLITGTATHISQATLGKSTYFGGRTPADGELHFNFSVAKAFNLIRAVADPWPNAFIRTEHGVVKIAWALPSNAKCQQGQFRLTKNGVLLGFADGALCIHAMWHSGMRSERVSDHMRWLEKILGQS